MITTTITIKKHLAEYLYGKYTNGDNESPVKLSTTDDLYHMMWQLMRKRPSNQSPVDEGNLTLLLDRKEPGKQPEAYNYLDNVSVNILEKKIEALFFMELHSKIQDNYLQGKPLTTQMVVHEFMCEYCIESISEDALIKNNYRFSEKISRRNKKREYRSNKLKTVK